MKINDWDISKANARQWNVTPGFHSISNSSEWDSGALNPAVFKNYLDFVTLKITLMVKGDGRQAILSNISEILSKLIEPAELVLDDFDKSFYGILKKSTHNEKAINHFHTLTLEMQGYWYGKELSWSEINKSSITVYNNGNIQTPAKAMIIALEDMDVLTIKGLTRDYKTMTELPITITGLVQGNIIHLNGETGLFTIDGKVSDAITIWALPALLPGENTITVSSSNVQIDISHKPRYM